MHVRECPHFLNSIAKTFFLSMLVADIYILRFFMSDLCNNPEKREGNTNLEKKLFMNSRFMVGSPKKKIVTFV